MPDRLAETLAALEAAASPQVRADMDPRYGMSPGTAGFCNGLDELLPQADLWLHGHLHCPTDVQVGRCRIVANPLGYADKQEQQAFVPQRLVLLP